MSNNLLVRSSALKLSRLVTLVGTTLIIISAILTACDQPPSPGAPPVTPPPAPPPLAQELILYNWSDDIPQSVLKMFTKEFGVGVKYETFDSQEEASEQLQKGKIVDVAVLENDLIPTLTASNLLLPINFRHVPNFKNISANFRDLATDPGNRHTVPYYYGTSGLVVRTDLVGQSVTRWADLWEPRYAGKIGLRAQPTELIAIALLSLGYAFGSEDEKQLEAALQRLIELKKRAIFVEIEADTAVARILKGDVAILYGWPEEYRKAHEANPAVKYVLPAEGVPSWGENFVIPATSVSPYTAEVFINFLLRPEIAAQMVNEKKYATANEAAYPLIKPEIRDDPNIFPPPEVLRRTHFYPPLTPLGKKRYDDIWKRFLAAGQ